jgi:hypothetical protein
MIKFNITNRYYRAKSCKVLILSIKIKKQKKEIWG